MCGRLFLLTNARRLTAIFGTIESVLDFPPRYNAAPTNELPVVRWNPKTGARSLDLLHWGLIPHWARDPGIGAKLINARAESLESKPSFRDAFLRRRCLVPADGFYEWQRRGARKQPYAIALKADGAVMAFAGLWENWRTPEGAWRRSFTIVTTEANALVRPIHDRMPVIVDPADYALWLGEAPAEPAALRRLLRPYPAEPMQTWPVSTRINDVRNAEAGLLDRLEPINSA